MQWLEKLEGYFVWEARSLYFVAMAAPLNEIYQPAALVIGGFGVLVVIVMVRQCFFFLGEFKGTCR